MSTAPELQRPVLWRNISFHLLWTSTFASGFGDRMAMLVAMAMLGYGATGADNSSIQAVINFFFFLPYLIWSPMAGWLTDRLPRKWVLLAADQSRGVILLCALLLAPSAGVIVPEGERWLVWMLMLGLGIMAATFVPARLSVVPSVVGMKLITRANGAVVSMGVIGNLFGLLLGASLVEHSLEQAIYVGAACYIISGLFWVFLRMPWEKKRTLGLDARHGPFYAFKEIGDGLRYAWQKRVVRVLVLMSAVVWGGTAVYVPAVAALNVELYGQQIGTYGPLLGMVGLGMLLGAIGLAVCNPIRGLEVLMVGGFFLLALCLGLQAVVPVLALGMVLSFGVGLSGALLMVPLHTLLQRVSANHVRGRVFGAKELVGEVGMVVISLMVWQMPRTDALMRPLMIGLAFLYIAVGIYGVKRYIMTGPTGTRTLNVVWRVIRLVSEGMHQLDVRGRGNMPRTGPALLVANHTAGTDPMLIQSAVQRKVRWMMANEYMFPALNFIWRRMQPIGVARTGRDATAARQAIAALRNGDAVAVFPEGRINRDREPLQEFSAGVGLIALRSGAPVVPIWIEGTPRGKVLGAYLRFSRSRVRFGEPFVVDPNMKPAEAAELMRQKVADLGVWDAEISEAATHQTSAMG